MGALVPADDLPVPSRLVPQDDLPEAPKPATEPSFLRRAAGAVWDMVKPGQYPHTAPAPARLPGESARDYATRGAHQAFQWASTPEGVGQHLSMAALAMPTGTPKEPTPNATIASTHPDQH